MAKRINRIIDMHHPTTLAGEVFAAFNVVAPRYGVRLEGIEDDANEHLDFWQQVAQHIADGCPATPPGGSPDGP